MYFYYKNKYENKSIDNEYLPKNFIFTNFFKNYNEKLLDGARKRL